MRHTCKKFKYKSKTTGEIVIGDENVWHCPGCAEKKVWFLDQMLGSYPFDWFITLTSDVLCGPPVGRILGLRLAREKLFDALKYKYGDFKFLWTFGVGEKGKMHLHLLLRGAEPDLKWLCKKWCKFTALCINTPCYIVDKRRAIPTDVGYIGWNAARLPLRGPDSKIFLPWDQIRMKGFRRMGRSQGLIPATLKAKGQWELISREKRWGSEIDTARIVEEMEARRVFATV